MKLLTEIPLTKADIQIDYDSEVLLLGSCFSEHMGGKFDYFKFRCLQNPFGILFHPKAIENLLRRAAKQQVYAGGEVSFHNERWYSYDAHSDLSDVSQKGLLKSLNRGLESTFQKVTQCTHIIITLGTAWAYRHHGKNEWVANCHKIPQREFSKELLSISDILKSLENIVMAVRSVNPDARVIFTVSPVRHLKDGFVENQRSKAHLISAVQQVLEDSSFADVTSYFPSYELMMDELRDYRFYNNDMVHPSSQAVHYIWEKFKSVWISEQAFPLMKKVDEVQKGLQHRPFHATSEAHQMFKNNLKKKIAYLQQVYPYMQF